ncbi:Butyrophilin subfamily 2 member A1, partial [Nibea albiflora]
VSTVVEVLVLLAARVDLSCFAHKAAFPRISPDRLQFFEYESVTVSCEGFSSLTEWRVMTKLNTVISPNSSNWDSSAASCTIEPAFERHSGEYWCEDAEGQTSGVLNISITAGSVILDFPARPVIEGSDVILHCRKDKTQSKHIADFYKDDLHLVTSYENNLIIQNVSKSDEGLYKCRISGAGESPESRLTVVTQSKSAYEEILSHGVSSDLSLLWIVLGVVLVAVVLSVMGQILCRKNKGQFQVVGPVQPLIVTIGEDVILPCHLKPAVDAVGMTIEWARLDLSPRFVHVWHQRKDLHVNQHPSYKGRTSVSINNLQHGDISLTLTEVRISDEGTYRCYLPDGKKDSTVQLVVGTASSLLISLAGIDKSSGGLVLQCEAKGWYPEPELFWLDGEGNLLSAGPTETVRGPDDLYTVSRRLTVRKSDSFTCRVQQKNINQTRETHFYVPETQQLMDKSEEMKNTKEVMVNKLKNQKDQLNELKKRVKKGLENKEEKFQSLLMEIKDEKSMIAQYNDLKQISHEYKDGLTETERVLDKLVQETEKLLATTQNPEKKKEEKMDEEKRTMLRSSS